MLRAIAKLRESCCPHSQALWINTQLELSNTAKIRVEYAMHARSRDAILVAISPNVSDSGQMALQHSLVEKQVQAKHDAL